PTLSLHDALPIWNEIRRIEQDICCHQHWVGKQAYRGAVLSLTRRLVLKLRHARSLTEPSHALQNPCQLRVRRYLRLHVQGRTLRINAQSNQLCCTSDGALAQF